MTDRSQLDISEPYKVYRIVPEEEQKCNYPWWALHPAEAARARLGVEAAAHRVWGKWFLAKHKQLSPLYKRTWNSLSADLTHHLLTKWQLPAE